jgi:hypothetical protein
MCGRTSRVFCSLRLKMMRAEQKSDTTAALAHPRYSKGITL